MENPECIQRRRNSKQGLQEETAVTWPRVSFIGFCETRVWPRVPGGSLQRQTAPGAQALPAVGLPPSIHLQGQQGTPVPPLPSWPAPGRWQKDRRLPPSSTSACSRKVLRLCSR